VPGPAGAEGAQGVKGDAGPVGPEGPQGIQGEQGIQGIPGLGIRFKGEVTSFEELPTDAVQGDLWVIGNRDDPSTPAQAYVWDETTQTWLDAGYIQGAQGVQGEQGVPGEVGPAGPEGPQGIQGVAGPTGADGPVGAKGDTGPQGVPGADGPAGADGAAGPAGPTAVSVDLENATTLGTDGLVYTASSVVGREVLVAADEKTAKETIFADFYVDPRDYGGVGDGVSDDTAALLAALAAVPKGGTVIIPAGIWTYNQDLVIPLGAVVRGDGRTVYKTHGDTSPRLRATSPDARIFVDTHTHLHDLLIDGGGVGRWAIQSGNPNTDESETGWLVSKSSFTNVFVTNFTEAAWVLEGTQNAVLANCTVRNTPVGFWFLHGAANCELFGCSYENWGGDGSGVGGASARAILSKDDWTDRRLAEARLVQDKPGYVNFSGGGGRDIRFFGGIYEYGPGDYRIEIVDGATYNFGTFLFAGTQIGAGPDALAAMRIGPNYNPLNHVVLTDTAWALNGPGNKLVIAESGTVKFRNHLTSGSSGKNLMSLTQVSGNARVLYDEVDRSLVDSSFDTSLYANEQYRWEPVTSDATATWNATKKCMNMSFINSFAGVSTYIMGQPLYGDPDGSVTVTFGLRNCTAPVVLWAFADGSGAYRRIGNFGDGAHTVVYNLVGDETRVMFASAENVPMTAECTFFRLEHGVTAGSTAPSSMSWNGTLKDTANKNWLEVKRDLNAVNWLQISNAAAGGSPRIMAAGPVGSAVNVELTPQGAGTLRTNNVQVEVKGHTHAVWQVAGAVELANTPASASSPGSPGQISYSSTHFFVCVATDTWRRVLLETW
jgi:hypothetical protein